MANGKKRKIRAGGSLIVADAKISFFNGTIYFLVYSRSCINQLLGCLCIQISQDGEGRVQPRAGCRQGDHTDSAPAHPAPALFKVSAPFYLHFLPYHFYFQSKKMMIFLFLSLSLPTNLGNFSAAITWQSSAPGTCHSTWKEMKEMVLASLHPW